MAYNPKNIELEKAIRKRATAKRHAAIDYKPPKHFRVFRNFLIGSIVVAMTSVLYTIYWFVIATSLKDGMAVWIADRARQGVVASYKQIEIGGFPFKYKVVLTDPKLQTADAITVSRQDLGGEKWLWQGGRAVAEMTPWNFKKFELDLSGTHQVTFANKGGAYQYIGTVQKLIMDAEIFKDGWPEKFQLDIAGLVLSETRSKAIISTKSASLTSHRLLPGGGYANFGASSATYKLTANMKDVRLPSFLNLPLGPNIQELTTEFSVIGHLAASRSVRNLTQWRDAGGIIEISLLDATTGPLKVHATGTLALDKELQPLIAMSANFQGFFQSINKLKNAGYIRTGDAAMAKLVLGVLSTRNGKGQRSISVPLTLQDGQLSVGPAPLMAVPAIDWGDDLSGPRKLGQ